MSHTPIIGSQRSKLGRFNVSRTHQVELTESQRNTLIADARAIMDKHRSDSISDVTDRLTSFFSHEHPSLPHSIIQDLMIETMQESMS